MMRTNEQVLLIDHGDDDTNNIAHQYIIYNATDELVLSITEQVLPHLHSVYDYIEITYYDSSYWLSDVYSIDVKTKHITSISLVGSDDVHYYDLLKSMAS